MFGAIASVSRRSCSDMIFASRGGHGAHVIASGSGTEFAHPAQQIAFQAHLNAMHSTTTRRANENSRSRSANFSRNHPGQSKCGLCKPSKVLDPLLLPPLSPR
jgi:hypothetical protein